MRGGEVDPTEPHRAVAEREPPRVEEGDGAVLSRRVESSGIAARLIPLVFMVAAGVGGLVYLTSPAARPLVDSDLSFLLLTGVALALPWWFRNVVWPDDPRDSQRRDERR